jgi:hypothetical protein
MSIRNRISTLGMVALAAGGAANASTPAGDAPQALGDSTAQLVYTPVTPCRIVDTRIAGGTLAVGVPRDFRVTGGDLSPQGGSPTGCGVPFGRATAAFINFVAVAPAGPGNLRTWPYRTPPPPAPATSIINYALVGDGRLNIANGVAVRICDPTEAGQACTLDIRVQADGSSAHLVADVLGFFERFPVEEVPALAVPRGAVVIWDQSGSCPPGYTRAGSLDGRFLRGAAAPGAGGGSEEHTHDVAHHHGMGNHTHGGTTASGGVDHSHQTSSLSFSAEETIRTGGGEVSFSQPKAIVGLAALGTGDDIFLRGFSHAHGTGGASAVLHSHAFSSGGPSTNTTDGASITATGAASSLPPFADVLFCRKD